ncbi:hypothetical protein BSL78_06219 [Apostichopus japonicus]|uniref:Uncharacterized protein n=1 Tax=Stichopus japonicus TaxID=307972 RepID=A0A2G8L9F2_STIJA|nr:hypothetical protein BSL78_06219 [Apostichopus japonicus]
MKKAKESGQDPYKAILVYRTTPLECNKSPSELLMNRNPRSNLPNPKHGLNHTRSSKPNDMKHSARQQRNYDNHDKDLPPLQSGDHVRFRDLADKSWAHKGQVIEQTAPEQNGVMRRNRRDLLKTNEPVTQPTHPNGDTVTDTGQLNRPLNPPESLSSPPKKRQIRPPTRLIETC